MSKHNNIFYFISSKSEKMGREIKVLLRYCQMYVRLIMGASKYCIKCNQGFFYICVNTPPPTGRMAKVKCQ